MAVMVKDLDAVKKYCKANELEEKVILGQKDLLVISKRDNEIIYKRNYHINM